MRIVLLCRNFALTDNVFCIMNQVAGSGIKDKWLSILDGNNDGSTTAIKDEACSNIDTLLTNAFLAANASNSLGQALFEAYSTVGYVPITQGEYDPIEETGCAQNLISPEYCSKPIPEDLGNVFTGSGSMEVKKMAMVVPRRRVILLILLLLLLMISQMRKSQTRVEHYNAF